MAQPAAGSALEMWLLCRHCHSWLPVIGLVRCDHTSWWGLQSDALETLLALAHAGKAIAHGPAVLRGPRLAAAGHGLARLVDDSRASCSHRDHRGVEQATMPRVVFGSTVLEIGLRAGQWGPLTCGGCASVRTGWEVQQRVVGHGQTVVALQPPPATLACGALPRAARCISQ